MIQTPSVKAIKLFFVADTVENKLECLALTNSSSLLANISLAWKNLSGPSASLFCRIISDEEKSFHKINTRWRRSTLTRDLFYKHFTRVNYSCNKLNCSYFTRKAFSSLILVFCKQATLYY